MRQLNGPWFVSALLLALLFTSSNAAAAGADESNLTTHAPISILGDDCFCDQGRSLLSCHGGPASDSGVVNCTNADGSQANPYRIAGWFIDASLPLASPSVAILIQNTQRYVIIDNVLVDVTNPAPDLPQGLKLLNSSNVTVTTSTFRNLRDGIAASTSVVTNFVAENNLLEGNSITGMIGWFKHAVIEGNTVQQNGNGLWNIAGDDVTIANNVVQDNSGNGIGNTTNGSVSNMQVTGNAVLSNGGVGIAADLPAFVTGNQISFNGVGLAAGPGAIVTANIFSENVGPALGKVSGSGNGGGDFEYNLFDRNHGGVAHFESFQGADVIIREAVFRHNQIRTNMSGPGTGTSGISFCSSDPLPVSLLGETGNIVEDNEWLDGDSRPYGCAAGNYIVDAGSDREGSAGSPITFDASSNVTTPVGASSYTWNWGDGSPAQQFNAAQGATGSFRHAYSQPGSYTARLTVVVPVALLGSSSQFGGGATDLHVEQNLTLSDSVGVVIH